MKKNALLVAVTAGVLCLGTRLRADELKSGPQVGSPMLNFLAYDVFSGKKIDYVEKYGNDLVVMIFARDLEESLVDLMKRVDKTMGDNLTDKRRKNFLAGVLIGLWEGEEKSASHKKLLALATDPHFKSAGLAIFNPGGPPKYHLHDKAVVTVIVYEKRKVLANYAFKKGELNDKAVKKIMGDVNKFLYGE